MKFQFEDKCADTKSPSRAYVLGASARPVQVCTINDLTSTLCTFHITDGEEVVFECNGEGNGCTYAPFL